MPEKKTMQRARRAKRLGKVVRAAIVREEIEKMVEGKRGERLPKVAVAIGLAKARRAVVKLGAAKRAAARTRRKVQVARKVKAAPRRARAVTKALQRAPRSTASPKALSRQTSSATKKRRRRRTAKSASR